MRVVRFWFDEDTKGGVEVKNGVLRGRRGDYGKSSREKYTEFEGHRKA
jgi:hypothetical protein